MKKELESGITINLLDKQAYYSHGNSSMLFALCDKPDKRNVIHQSHRFVECREEFVRQLIQEVHKNVFTRSVDISKLRVLVKRQYGKDILASEKIFKRVRDKFRSDVINGLKILNAFEEHNEWEATHIIDSNHDGVENQFVCLLEGSDQWLKAPFMLSLWSLMLRLGTNVKTRKNRYKSNKKAMDRLLKWSSKSNKTDANHVGNTIKFWDTLMKHYDEIIDNLPKKKLFNTEQWADGVTRLCCNRMVVNESLYCNLMKIHKKEKNYGL